jgi:hypothetical protein
VQIRASTGTLKDSLTRPDQLTRLMHLTRDGSRTRPDQLTCPDYQACHGYLTRRRAGIQGTPADQYYSGPFTGSVCQSGDPEFLSTGNNVHASGKYPDIALFWQIGRFNPRLNLQNSGLVLAPIF